MIYATAAVFYAFLALVVWDDTSKENAGAMGICRRRTDRLPTPWVRGVFWFPIMLVALVQVAGELIREAGSVIRSRR